VEITGTHTAISTLWVEMAQWVWGFNVRWMNIWQGHCFRRPVLCVTSWWPFATCSWWQKMNECIYSEVNTVIPGWLVFALQRPWINSCSICKPNHSNSSSSQVNHSMCLVLADISFVICQSWSQWSTKPNTEECKYFLCIRHPTKCTYG